MTHNTDHLIALPDLSRRTFLQVLGGGLVIVVVAETLEAQERPPEIPSVPAGGGEQQRGRRGGRPQQQVPVAARVHIDKDGHITVMTGKVECGQGARAELTQAAAEELHVAPQQVKLLMADTSVVPDDGITAGSRTTPSTVPAVRGGAAAARDVLIAIAAKKWNLKPEDVAARDGKIVAGDRAISYGELASDEEAAKDLQKNVPANQALAGAKEWKVLGTSLQRPNARDLVTGAHQYPSDVSLPGMLHGKVLRPPALAAKLTSIDTDTAKSAAGDVTVVQDGNFIGVAAPNTRAAMKALSALAQSAKWDIFPRAPSSQLFTTLREKGRSIPQNPFADALARAAKQFRQTYNVSYIQHAPMEPRAAVAQWDGKDKLTVWTGSQNPFGVRSELARAFSLDAQNVRVIVPDFGGGFGGKHSGECAVEAARLAKVAGKPVSLRWTRAEEFTWAYFRPAGLIDVAAGLDDSGTITSWHQVNINSGPQSVETPYRIAQAKGEFVQSDPPLRHGSYRALAATANTFARETAMDELANLAGKDPLEFRLAHIADERLRAVVEAAAKKFNWTEQVKNRAPNTGVGIACGIEKGSWLATCAAVEVHPSEGTIRVSHVAAAFDCGKITNPDNLLRQARGAIVMGIGAALRERIEFDENGKIKNGTFWKYEVPRFADVPPKLEVELIDRPDQPSLGAGETPIIGIAPAIANAVFQATGTRLREMPLRLKA